MRLYEIAGVGRITKQNQTPDVGPDAVQKQAAKFGNVVDRDGRPPLLHSKAYKNTTPNKLWNLGLTESIAVIENINPKIFDPNFHQETSANTKAGVIRLVAKHYSSNVIPQIVVKAFANNDEIGYVRFVAIDTDQPTGIFKRFKPRKDPYLIAANVSIDPAWRRKGVAGAMYNFIRSLGNNIKPSTVQTGDGKSFWQGGAGVKENYSSLEIAIIEGGHSLDEWRSDMRYSELDEDFTGAAKPGSRPGSLKRKAAQYLGKGAGEKLTKSDLRKLQAKANKMKQSEKKAERQRGIQLARQVSWARNFGVAD